MAVYGFEVHITYLKVDAVPSLFDVDHLTHVAHTVASQQLDPSMHGDHWCTTVAKSDGARCQGVRSSWRTNTHWASDPRGDAFSQNRVLWPLREQLVASKTGITEEPTSERPVAWC